MERTKLTRRWLIKMIVVFIGLVGLGLYGYYDATIGYPKRGIKYAEFAERAYLVQAEMDRALPGAGVQDGFSELAKLRAMGSGMSSLQATRLEWLRSLDVVGQITPERTNLTNPRQRLTDLNQQWSTSSAPKRLTKWDIPVQWIFVLVGLGGGLYIGLLFAGVARKTYRWDPESKKLTLPDRSTIEPSDLEEVDKRKWHKFLVHLAIKDSHANHGGKRLKFDLYRYQNLEDWILEMEQIAFPENVEEENGANKTSPDPTDGEQSKSVVSE